MLSTDTFSRLCRARDLLPEVPDRPLTPFATLEKRSPARSLTLVS